MHVEDESPAGAEVTTLLGGRFVRMDYTWAYHGTPQEGSLLIGFTSGPAVVTAQWIDTWHMGERVMSCRGTADPDGSIVVRGTYAVPPGADWGWRIVLRPDDGQAIQLVMYNLRPDGSQEVAELAVEADYTRSRCSGAPGRAADLAGS